MATRRDRSAEATRGARAIRLSIGADIRNGRLLAGVSQASAARAVGISRSQFGRIERAEIRGVTVEQLARACSAVGSRLTARAYPDGEPVRDAAHLALIGRMHAVVPTSSRWRNEVPMSINGDLRAWDAVMECPEGQVAVEAETRLHDLQALQRRIALKQRDSRFEIVILLVNDTAANRRVLGAHREDLRPMFPLDGREVLAALRAGRRPTASGLVVL